jgi:hypothetical protein
MFFLKHPLRPVNGSIAIPHAPGVDMELDAGKIESAEELRG